MISNRDSLCIIYEWILELIHENSLKDCSRFKYNRMESTYQIESIRLNLNHAELSSYSPVTNLTIS